MSYEDTSAEMLMKSVPEVVLHKVPDELGDVGRGIYKYKMVEGVFVLKDDLSDWEGMNKRAIINSYRSQRNELLAQTDWTQTEDCPLDIHMKEMYRAYRKFLRDFPQTHDPVIDEHGEAVDDYKLPKTLDEFALETKV
jgi:hypothetical protein